MLNTVYFSHSTDPYYNLALEDVLFHTHEGGATLYLWQNENTVVIGKNQNAWKECRVNLLEGEGGKLARRSSGGGAVYHDLGNLNFTFIVDRAAYDVERQLSVIQRAAKHFDVDTAFTGRNDLVVEENGAKFSGNAFRFSTDVGMHHGTILIDVDMQRLARFLAPSKEKLAAKGIESVRARVMNLKECNEKIDIESMKRALVDAFIEVYGPARLKKIGALDENRLLETVERYASWEWRLGRTPAFDIELAQRFSWGELQLHLSLKDGAIIDCAAYSDAMDEAFIGRIAPALMGCKFQSAAMGKRIRALDTNAAQELSDWILEKGF